MEHIKTAVDQDHFAKYIGIRLLEVSKGRATAELSIEGHHLNGLGLVHGGAIFTLADLVFAAASNSYGIDALAINANISYFKATRGGKLFAEAKEVSLTRKLATYSIDVTDETGDKVAIFQGTAYRKTPRKE